MSINAFIFLSIGFESLMTLQGGREEEGKKRNGEEGKRERGRGEGGRWMFVKEGKVRGM